MSRQTVATITGRPPIVALCGSTRYWDALAETNLHETAAGRIVLAPGCNLKQPHPMWADPVQADQLKAQLDTLHRHKIDLADEVLIEPGRLHRRLHPTRHRLRMPPRQAHPLHRPHQLSPPPGAPRLFPAEGRAWRCGLPVPPAGDLEALCARPARSG